MKYLIFILGVLFITANTQASEMDTYGIKGIPFETSIKHVPNLTLTAVVGDTKYYSRTDETFLVDGIHVSYVTYGFYKDLFRSIEFDTVGEENSAALLKHLKKDFTCAFKETIDGSVCKCAKVVVRYSKMKSTGNATTVISSDIINQIEIKDLTRK